MMREITCVLCPKGCLLVVDTSQPENVSGNSCPRGVQYGYDEIVAPKRTVCSTVMITGAEITRMPVKTSRPILREKMQEVMAEIKSVYIHAPVVCGDAIVTNICNTGADIVATRTLEVCSPQMDNQG